MNYFIITLFIIKKFLFFINNPINNHTDYFTREQYTSKNIIVTKLDFTYTDDNYYLDLHNIGTGDGYYITNGYAVPIKWEKNDRSSKTVYKYLDGTPINVNDGNTWIMLQSINKTTAIN